MRHIRKHYMVVGEGILSRDEGGKPICYRPPSDRELREFRFSRIGPKGKPASDALCAISRIDDPICAEPAATDCT